MATCCLLRTSASFLWSMTRLGDGAGDAEMIVVNHENGFAKMSQPPAFKSSVAERIDASQFNRRFPKVFPRFVQHAMRMGWTSAMATRSMTTLGATTRIAGSAACADIF